MNQQHLRCDASIEEATCWESGFLLGDSSFPTVHKPFPAVRQLCAPSSSITFYFQGLIPQRLSCSRLIQKMVYPFYTPAVSSTCSLWQVLAPTPQLSVWASLFPQSLSPLPSEPGTLHYELPASCTAQKYLGTGLSVWGILGCFSSISLL